jgi:hypothetical protein
MNYRIIVSVIAVIILFVVAANDGRQPNQPNPSASQPSTTDDTEARGLKIQ